MGRYGQFEAYEPAPDVGADAFRFKLANGDTKLFSGPNALDLASRIDAYDQAQPRTALSAADVSDAARPKLIRDGDRVVTGNDGIPRVMLSDPNSAPVWQTASRPEPRLPTAAENRALSRDGALRAAANKGSAPVGGDASATPPPASIARLPPAEEALVASGGKVPIGPGTYRDAQGNIHDVKYVAGTKGITKEQLAARDAGAVAQRTGQTEQIVEGTPQSQEYLDTRSALRDAEYDALVKQRADEQAALDEQSRVAAEYEREQLRLGTEAQARAAELDTKFKHEEELRNKAIAEYSNSSVNPNRIFSNPAVGILGALAAGAGAYAAVIGKTQNFAQQAIDSAIERDIRAQEAQIRIKGETKDTLIGQLRDTGLSRDQAHATAKQIMYQHHIAQNDAAKLRHAGTALENKFNNIGIALQQGWNEADEQGRVAGRDKVVRSVQSGFAHERAATAGRVVDTTLTAEQSLNRLGKLQDLEKGDIANQKGRQELAAGPKVPPASPEKRKAMAGMAEAARLQKSLAGIPDDTPAVPPNKRGPIDRTIAGIGEWAGGEGGGARLLLDETEQRELADLLSAKEQIKNLRSVLSGQGALDEQGSKRSEAALAPGATAGEVKRALADLYASAQTANIAADATGEAGGTVVTK